MYIKFSQITTAFDIDGSEKDLYSFGSEECNQKREKMKERSAYDFRFHQLPIIMKLLMK